MTLPHERLDVWQKAMSLVEQIYRATGSFPASEQFGLTSQLRRSAISIPANIAEGKGRYHKKEFLQFLYNARGSLYEVMTLLQITSQLHYLSNQQYQMLLQQAREILGKLSGLINYLKGNDPREPS